MKLNQTKTAERRRKISAIEVLRAALADGPLPAEHIRDIGASAGVSWRSMQRASQSLNVQRHKSGMAGGWIWALPAAAPEGARSVGAFAEQDHTAAMSCPVICLAAYNFEVPSDGLMHAIPHRD